MNYGINTLDWVCIGLYSLILFSIAIYHSRKLKRQDDVFLAGRSISRWPIAISMYMALFSTNTFLGATGWVNRPNGTIWIALQTSLFVETRSAKTTIGFSCRAQVSSVPGSVMARAR